MAKYNKRDWNILKSFRREISLATKVVKDKKAAYSRKCKHRKMMFAY